MTHMDKSLDVLVVGLSCVDSIAAGEFSKSNVQNPVGDVHISAGGLGNALVALSGMDLSIGVSTRVGDDMYGDYLLKQWKDLDIDISGVTVDRERATGFSFILDHGGERTPFYSAGANSAFGLGDIPTLLPEKSRCVLVFFASALPSLDGEPMLKLVKRCHAARTVVILDTSDGVLADHRAIPSYLPYANLVVSSEEGRAITGKDVPEEMLRNLDAMAGDAPDGRKVKSTMHWVSAKHAVEAEVRLYDYLFTKRDSSEVEEGADYKSNLNPKSLEVLKSCKLEPGLKEAKPGSRCQFERKGYFCIDTVDSSPEKLVFNHSVSLRDPWEKILKAQQKK